MTNHPSYSRQVSWSDVRIACAMSVAVNGYHVNDSMTGGSVYIEWCDGSTEEIKEPIEVINAISSMERN